MPSSTSRAPAAPIRKASHSGRVRVQRAPAPPPRPPPPPPAPPLGPPPPRLQIRGGRAATFDPLYTETVADNAIADQLFAGLVERTPEMDIVPDLARSWGIHEAGRKYLFQLRPDARWSDGVPGTA